MLIRCNLLITTTARWLAYKTYERMEIRFEPMPSIGMSAIPRPLSGP
jgi:hypothetical protein